jgi:hypothetical protein
VVGVTHSWEGVAFRLGDVIPMPPPSPDKPWFICLSCDTQFSRRSAPNPISVGDFVFCSIEYHSRWFNEGRLGMS